MFSIMSISKKMEEPEFQSMLSFLTLIFRGPHLPDLLSLDIKSEKSNFKVTVMHTRSVLPLGYRHFTDVCINYVAVTNP